VNEIVISNIKRIMEEKDLTMYSIDKNGGVSKQLMSSILKHGNPTIDTLQKISKCLEVDIIELFKEVI